MADQADAAALAVLGRQLYDASRRGEAAEAARLLDLNAPIEHRVGEDASGRRSWKPLVEGTSRWSLSWRTAAQTLRRA